MIWIFNILFLELLVSYEIQANNPVQSILLVASNLEMFRTFKLHTHFFQNILLFVATFFLNLDYLCLKWYFHRKQVWWGFNINHLTFGDKIVRVLVLQISNHLPKTKAESSLKYLYKRSPRDWFGLKCIWKVSSYLDN